MSRNKIVDEAILEYQSNGLYNYSYITSTSATSGVYESVITANYSGNIVYLNDFWIISTVFTSGEASLSGGSIGKIQPSKTAFLETIKMGAQPSMYEYIYLIFFFSFIFGVFTLKKKLKKTRIG